MNTRNDNLQLGIPEARSQKATPPALVERAMGAAAHLIHRFANGLNFYWNTKTSVLEQWTLESYPEVIGELQTRGVYANFVARLDAYREDLITAAATASAILEYEYNDVLEGDIDSNFILSSLSSRTWSDDMQHMDRETFLVSFLLDRHDSFHCQPYHDSLQEAPAHHSKIILQDESWNWCDISKAKTARPDVAHLITREHFPSNAATYTNEEYALVIRVPHGTDLSSLVAPNFIGSVNIRAGDGPAERSITFSGLPFRIPMVANEQMLRCFRNFLSVLYLHDGGGLLVEFPWAPATDFFRCLYPSIGMDMPPEIDDESDEL